MLDLQRQYLQIRSEVLAAIENVCASQHYILGAEVEALERELAGFCGARDAVGCASGTDALWLALSCRWSAARGSGSHHAVQLFRFGQRHRARGRASGVCRYRSATFNLDPSAGRIFSAPRPA